MSTAIKAIIIDDEQHCIDNLQHRLAACCSDIQVVATGRQWSDVATVAGAEHINVAFLDIELCDQNIFDSLDSISAGGCRIFFVTAYSQYATQAFRVDALDYLVKPLDTQDVLSCCDKIQKWMRLTSVDAGPKTTEQQKSKRPQTIALRQGDKMYLVQLADILYLEAKGIYTQVCFLDNDKKQEILVSKILSKLEKEYAAESLFRIHKSYIVNTLNIDAMIKNAGMHIRMKSGDMIPVAKRRVPEFIHYLKSQTAG